MQIKNNNLFFCLVFFVCSFLFFSILKRKDTKKREFPPLFFSYILKKGYVSFINLYLKKRKKQRRNNKKKLYFLLYSFLILKDNKKILKKKTL